MNDRYWPFPDANHNLNMARDPSLPELHPTTCTLLDNVWDDDYESFGLVNPGDDMASYLLVCKLDRLVREDGPPGTIDNLVQALPS